MRNIKLLTIILLLFFICPTQVAAAGFSADAVWNGRTITVSYSGYDVSGIGSGVKMFITNASTGKSWQAMEHKASINKPIEQIKLQTTGSIPTPLEGEEWQIAFEVSGVQSFTVPVNCWYPEQELGNNEPADNILENMENWKEGGMPIFPGESHKVVMFWYYSLATISGAFMFLVFIRSGYQHMFSVTTNPGVKASAIMTIQRGFVGLIIIMLAPFLINILIMANDAFVDFCRQLLETVSNAQPMAMEDTAAIGSDNNFLDKLFGWVLDALNSIMTTILGLTPLGDIIFNQTPDCAIFQPAITGGDFVNSGNGFIDSVLRFVMLLYTLYFNAVYVIRRWVVTAVLAVTPIIIWIWVITEHKQIIGLWAAELVQTIFMQTFHALTFGIVFSVLAFSGGNLNYVEGASISALLIEIGKYVAAFGGVACVAVLTIQAYRIILNSNEKERVDALGKIRSAFIGLLILGLSYMAASAIFPQEIVITSLGDGDKESTKITYFVLFFALVAILPIAKMLSNIFMNILARFGTVDEMRAASGGLGGLAKIGGAAAGALTAGNSGGSRSNSSNSSNSNNSNSSSNSSDVNSDSNAARTNSLTNGDITGGNTGTVDQGGITTEANSSPSATVMPEQSGSDHMNTVPLERDGEEVDPAPRITNLETPEESTASRFASSAYSDVKDMMQQNKSKYSKISDSITKTMAAGATEMGNAIAPGTGSLAGAAVGLSAMMTMKVATPLMAGADVAKRRAGEAIYTQYKQRNRKMDDR
ncbi:hypothetical protein ASZ90_017332 [hydrocarbon metagenome]|uniref:Uncharacterized protein n=1 Tax=hydrocarbon metagenome TaxID=938273 RepID=A0A0W8E9E8_9ZZZZ